MRIHADPDPGDQMNADPCGSGSVSLIESMTVYKNRNTVDIFGPNSISFSQHRNHQNSSLQITCFCSQGSSNANVFRRMRLKIRRKKKYNPTCSRMYKPTQTGTAVYRYTFIFNKACNLLYHQIHLRVKRVSFCLSRRP